MGLNFRQEAREADLRYGLVRVRENAESIAFYRGRFVRGWAACGPPWAGALVPHVFSPCTQVCMLHSTSLNLKHRLCKVARLVSTMLFINLLITLLMCSYFVFLRALQCACVVLTD